MTARERARIAANESTDDYLNTTSVRITCADAASDVWEPIVRAFVDSKAGENEHGVYWQTSKLREAYSLAEKALGG